MKNVMQTVIRYLLLFITFAKNSLAGQMEYRVNFIAGILVETGYMLAKLTYVELVYSANVTINGMSPDYILLFIGTYAMMTGFYMFFVPNFYALSGYIKDGTLDIYLTKPVSGLFIISFRQIDFAMPIPNLLGGMIMVIIGWKRCGFSASLLNIAVFLLFILLGIILTYGLFLLPRLLAFWVISINGITQICDSIWDFNNMPMGIYHRIIQGLGCFLFPVFLITNVPGMIIGGHINHWFIIWSIIAPFLILSITITVWRVAIKRYASASC